MRGLNIGSPSVAYRHLQKLEDAKLVTKNEYGAYFIKKKSKVKGSAGLVEDSYLM